jgi:hypothetical protein
MDILSAYNIRQIIDQSSGINREYFEDTAEKLTPIAVTVVTYNYIDLYYEDLMKTLIDLRKELTEEGGSYGEALVVKIDDMSKNMTRQHDVFQAQFADVFNQYASNLDRKEREMIKEMIKTPKNEAVSKN